MPGQTPILIREVLSESTVQFDYGKKFIQHKKLDSLQEYVIIDQKSTLVQTFLEDGQGNCFVFSDDSKENTIKLHSLGLKLSMSKLYKNLSGIHEIQLDVWGD